MTRRRFIGGGAAVAGATVIGAVLDACSSDTGTTDATTTTFPATVTSVTPAPTATAVAATTTVTTTAPAPAASLNDIEHFVILFQENRSCDHYFGTRPGVAGFASAVSGECAPLRRR